MYQKYAFSPADVERLEITHRVLNVRGSKLKISGGKHDILSWRAALASRRDGKPVHMTAPLPPAKRPPTNQRIDVDDSSESEATEL